jgi:two-component system sensor histidine kinase YesM
MKSRFKYPKLNNIRVRDKLLMIYILCIVAPVLVTNLIFADRIIRSVKKENGDQCNAIMDTALLNIDRDFERIINLSTLIYTDRSLDQALERDYSGSVERIDVYAFFRDYMARIRSMYTQIVGVSIYTDNKTIPFGGSYIYNNVELDALDWYGRIRDSGKTVNFTVYVQNDGKYLSVLRNMDYFADSRSRKIMKIDLNLNEIASTLKGTSGRWDIYLVSEAGEIITSSNNGFNNMSGFASLEDLAPGPDDNVIVRDLGRYDVLRGWKLLGVFRQDQLYESLQRSGGFVAVMALLDLVAATAVILLISRSINRRLNLVAAHMRKHDLRPLDVEEGADEIGEVIREYNRMAQKIQDMIRNEYEYSIEIKNAELERRQAVINALQSQINPHFLFNTLEAIRMRSSLKNEDETAGIIKSLSKMFRRMLNWKEDLIPLSEEIGFVEDYLKVQHYRFGGKVRYRIDVGPGAGSIGIPKMTIQPFVENSCVHGIEEIRGDGFILIRAALAGGRLDITIGDNGKGMVPDELSGLLSEVKSNGDGPGSIGIRNVYNRLKLLYGDELRLDIAGAPGAGVTVSISIPAAECPPQGEGRQA